MTLLELSLTVRELRAAAKACAGKHGAIEVIVRETWHGIDRRIEIEFPNLGETIEVAA